jgi:predicted transcriptional regulator
MEALTDIRKRRLSLGIPLGEVARAVGRSDATLSRIERGQIRPSYDLVQSILRYLEEREGVAAPHMRASDVMHTEVVCVDASSSLSQASEVMERGGFSQAPVVDGGRVTGSISETAILRTLARPEARRIRVRDVQEGAYPQVDASCPADLLTSLLGRYPAVLVVRRGELCGIVAKSDLIRGLRGTSLRRPPGAAPP